MHIKNFMSIVTVITASQKVPPYLRLLFHFIKKEVISKTFSPANPLGWYWRYKTKHTKNKNERINLKIQNKISIKPKARFECLI